MKRPVLTLRRSELVAAGACAEWLGVFDTICRLRGDDHAPWVRRGGVSRRDPERLRVELSPLAQVWLARDGQGALRWLRGKGLMGPANLTRANLTRANLTRANLTRANLTGADLYRANLYGANLTGADLYRADLYGADLYGADLTGANLTGADLTGADLTRARRWSDDSPIAGWTLRDGVLVREVAA